VEEIGSPRTHVHQRYTMCAIHIPLIRLLSRIRAYSRKREQSRESERPFDSRASTHTRTPLDYALASTMARVNIARALARAHARVRARPIWRYECRCVFRPLYFIRVGIQPPVLLRQLSARRISRPAMRPSPSSSLSLSLSLSRRLSRHGRSHTSIPCVHARTPSLFGAHERTVPGFPDQIGRRGPPAIPTAPIDSEIKGRVHGKGGDPSDFRSEITKMYVQIRQHRLSRRVRGCAIKIASCGSKTDVPLRFI